MILPPSVRSNFAIEKVVPAHTQTRWRSDGIGFGELLNVGQLQLVLGNELLDHLRSGVCLLEDVVMGLVVGTGRCARLQYTMSWN
jgi:hypothetical protein